MVSAGLDVTGNLIYTDADSIALADNVKEAAIVEKQDGGVYILYLKDEKINIIQADVSGQFTYYYNMLDKVESVRSAVSGSVFLYKTKEKWQSGEFARYDNSRFDGCISLNGELPSIGDTYVKLTMLNAVNRPNAACENEKTIYYLYRNGSMYRTEGKANEVAAYCEFYIPFKTGGVMVWSKKLCVSRQGA